MWLSTVDSSRCFHPSNLEYHLQCKCAQYRGLAMSRQLRDAREQGRGRGGGGNWADMRDTNRAGQWTPGPLFAPLRQCRLAKKSSAVLGGANSKLQARWGLAQRKNMTRICATWVQNWAYKSNKTFKNHHKNHHNTTTGTMTITTTTQPLEP